MNLLRQPPGQRFLVGGWWLGLALLVAALGCHAAPAAIRSIRVVQDGATYVCDVDMLVPVSHAVAWTVLTDFDHMAQWVPNVRSSRVVQRDAAAITVAQRGVVKFGVAGFPYATERRVELHRNAAIHAIQTKGSLQRVESLMLLEPEGASTHLTYHLELVPSRLAGVLLSAHAMEQELAEQFGAIVGEMLRRGR